jgi:sugar phosphate isomerase/epimerase
MAAQFSLAYLTIPGIDPVEQIKIARDAGYDYVSLRTIPMGLCDEPQARLEKSPELFRMIRQTLRDCQMKLLDIELVQIREDLPPDFRRSFEKGAELGATQVLSSVWTKDRSFAVDRYGTVCEQAAQYGLTVNLEFPVLSSLTTLKEAAALQDQVKASNLKILMDMLYVHWAKVTPEEIRALDPERFGLIHLCDCPKNLKNMDEAQIVHVVREGRAYCGEGEIDLKGLLKALPPSPCSIELPNIRRIAELGAAGHAARCLETAKALFENIGV